MSVLKADCNWEDFEKAYGSYASWAIWNKPEKNDEKGTSNIDGRAIFTETNFKTLINGKWVFVGLNASGEANDYPWSSFHKEGSMDYKLRYALQNSVYEGSYITDVIKGKVDHKIKASNSKDVIDWLHNNKDVLERNINSLKVELGCFDGEPTLIAMGDSVYEILVEYMGTGYRVMKIPHYSGFYNKETYRAKVLASLDGSFSMDFLICCYFGQSKDLINAAIDRAYVDMAAHTMKDLPNYVEKWEYRYNASMIIKNRLIKYPDGKTYKDWHEEVVIEIIRVYPKSKLKYGQAQKWLNMTVKYLYTLSTLVGIEDNRLISVKSFLSQTSANDYYPPVDSYVLAGAGIKGVTWSTLNKDRYDACVERFDSDMDFLWELKYWEEFVKEYGKPDKKSYSYYRSKKEEENVPGWIE